MVLFNKKLLFHLMVFFVVLVVTPIKRVHAESVVVVANSFSNSRRLTNSDIEDIFTLRNKKWDNGIPIKLFVLPKDSPRTQEFTLKFLNMSPNRYFDLLEQKNGFSRNVEVLDYEYSMMIKILTTPGGVGYVSDSYMTNFNGDLNILGK